MQMSDQLLHFLQWEAFGIQGKDFAEIHVIDIRPHRLQWDGCRGVVVHNIGHLVDVLHAVTAPMEAQTPVGHHNRQANDLTVLLSNVDRAWTSQEIEIDNATECIIFQILSCRGGIVDLDVHTVAVEEKDAMRFVGCLSVFKIYWMVSIKVRSGWLQVRIARPQRAYVVGTVGPERISVLPQSIDI